MDRIYTLERYLYSLDTSLGRILTPEKKKFCYSLEDVVRADGVKVSTIKEGKKSGFTAIPGGSPGNAMRYKMHIAESTRFKREVVYLSNTPDYWRIAYKGIEFKGVCMHGGNDHSHSDGCPLIAYNLFEKEFKIQGTAEKEWIELIRQEIKAGNSCYLDVINLPATMEIKI